MPRVLARLPYGAATKPIEEFDYEEAPFDADGAAKAMDHDDYCWMNAAYVHGRAADRRLRPVRLLHRDPRRRGRRQGREPADPRLHLRRRRPRREVPDRDRHHRPPRGRAVATSASCRCATTRTPTTPCSSAARRRRSRRSTTGRRRPRTPRSRPACRTSWRRSRFAHYLKVMARDKIGSFMEATDCEDWLNRWIQNYVNANEKRRPGDEGAATRCARRKVEVKEIPGKPGSYNAVALSAPVAAVGGTDDLAAHGRAHPAEGLNRDRPARRGAMSGGLRPESSARRAPHGAAARSGAVRRFFGDRMRGRCSVWLAFAGEPRRMPCTMVRRGWPACRDPEALRGALDRDIAAHRRDAIGGSSTPSCTTPRLRRLEGSWRGLDWLVDGVAVRAAGGVKVRCSGALGRSSAATSSAPSSSTRASCSARSTRRSSARPAASPSACWSPTTRSATCPAAGAPDRRRDGAAPQLAAVARRRLRADRPRRPSRRCSSSMASFRGAGARASLADTAARRRHARWRSLAAREDMRFLGVALPRVLGRRPGRTTAAAPTASATAEHAPDADHRVWMSAVYAFAAVACARLRRYALARRRARRGDATGVGGGLVDDLPHRALRHRPARRLRRARRSRSSLTDEQERAAGRGRPDAALGAGRYCARGRLRRGAAACTRRRTWAECRRGGRQRSGSRRRSTRCSASSASRTTSR